jgi:endonuclease YncB( thermonuclease family)
MPQRDTKGTRKLLGRFVLLCAFFCIAVANVNAASLFGKVIEVNSGDVITIFNLNRPVRVRVLGIDAPEMEQAFGDVARKHLADLVSDKSVLVQYWGIDGDHSVTGRVSFEGIDIGAQMIRDGAAWVDPGSQQRLSATDREVYQESEAAARNERRGLWQQENPVAPWEFARALAMRKAPAATLNSLGPARKYSADRPTPELTNLTLMGSRVAGASASTSSSSLADLPGFLVPVNGGNWHVLRPARETFSVLVPEEGETMDLPDRGSLSYAHMYRGRDGRAAFVVMWLSGPTYGESDVAAVNQTVGSFFTGFGMAVNARIQRQEPASSCELQNQKDISMRGFTGLEFETSCTVPARARVFTRLVNGDRQMYLAIALYMEKDDNINRFINSFTITPPAISRSKKK